MAFHELATWTMVRRTACVVVLAASVIGAPAFADCEADFATLTKRTAATTDAATHALLAKVMRNAEKELFEGDEEECAADISDANRIPKSPGPLAAGQTATAP